LIQTPGRWRVGRAHAPDPNDNRRGRDDGRMDRQLRNIALLTLAMASLAVAVPILLSESHRTGGQTALLVIALVGAGGSLLALVVGSLPFGVLIQDLGRVWDARPRRKWAASHAVAEVVRETVNMGMGQTMVFTLDAEVAIREQGVPCIVLRLEPRMMSFARTRPLGGATVTCSLSRRAGLLKRPTTRQVDVRFEDSPKVLNAAFGRWPDDWFDGELQAPVPSIYRVEWEVRQPDGRVQRPREHFHVADHGETHDGKLRQAGRAIAGLYRHYRCKD
jgi:hypothetical protein